MSEEKRMTVDDPKGQNMVALFSATSGTALAAGIYWAGYPSLAWGIIFGVTLMILNYRVVSKILRIAFSFSSIPLVRGLAFLIYHSRFAILAVIMFLVLTRQSIIFGVGTFIGIVIPKIFMGILVVRTQEAEWWRNSVPTTDSLPLSPLERELATRNPFEVDPVEIELRCYMEKRNKEEV